MGGISTTLGIVFLLFFNSISGQSISNNKIIAKIKTNHEEGVLSITGIVTNKGNISVQDLYYRLSVVKIDTEENLSRSNQKGRFGLNGNENKHLTELSLNSDKDDTIVARLFIYNQDKVICKDHLVI
ncbi:hypothetical protein [Aquimarina algicola]|uniref:DUF2393 domain-containing protein n=1 Tax=Aquimarina algicola TaxID=2589995 RepID=A0A504JCE0_9FLAO|nr:hypothetical protein [Aquimarina algicola]TPN84589.1 hypothetical protein FHK87_16805 [Aquimarina algicola]